MNQKQLANVLTKILGLFFCAQSVMHILTGILNLLTGIGSAGVMRGVFWANFLSAAVLGSIGTVLIVRSPLIVDKIFKNE